MCLAEVRGVSANCRTQRCRIISSAGFGRKAEGRRAGTKKAAPRQESAGRERNTKTRRATERRG